MTTQPSRHHESTEQSLVEIVVEAWRLSRLFGRVLEKLDAGEQRRYVGRLRFFEQRLTEHALAAGLTVVTTEGQRYDHGMAVSPINGGDFGPTDVLLVDQMVEPIILSAGGVRRQGAVLLRKEQ